MNVDGTEPDDSNLLNSAVMNGASTSAFSFSSHVVSGSLKHCLSESARTAVMTLTSPTPTDRNCEKPQPDGAGVNDGGGASAVAAWTAATFALKKTSKSFGPISQRKLTTTHQSIDRSPQLSWQGTFVFHLFEPERLIQCITRWYAPVQSHVVSSRIPRLSKQASLFRSIISL